jgi:tetratricopeptide (TPR) repeat protein
MNYRVLSVILTAVASLIFGEAMCQMMPERRLVRKGNRQYERQDFDASLDSYAKALQEDPTSFEAKFNTANGQFRKELIDKSEQTLRKLAQDSTRTDIERSEVVYNLGNALFVQQRLEEALECYRNAMRLNPEDKDAKFNYALTKELLKQQQQNQQQQQQQQDQNQNQDQNQDQQQQQQNQDQKEQENKQDEQEQQQEQPQNFSEQEQEAMLEAIQAQEDKTQDKLKDKKGVLIRGGKNW